MVSKFLKLNAALCVVILMITTAFDGLSSTKSNFYVKNSIKFDQGSYNHNNILLNSSDLFPVKPKRKHIIVIDAGHGGKDTGAKGKLALEKDLNLSMALKTAKLIEKSYPNVEVHLTRNIDVFLPLFRRIQYANEQNADLFISIHCNYMSNPKIRGTETFVLGTHRMDDNLEVAKRENSSIFLEHNYESNYEGFDFSSPESHIMLSMCQNAYLDKSIEFAAGIEAQFADLHISRSRGVKQAGFAVLRRATMPAVLVEAGFLSNDVDEQFLMTDDGQQIIAESITRAFGKFYEKNMKDKDVSLADPINTQVLEKTVDITEASKAKNTSMPATSSQPQTSTNVNNESKPVSPTINTTNNTISDKLQPGQEVFRVQIAALKDATVDMNTPELRQIGTLTVVRHGEYNKYLVGDYLSRASAEIARERLKLLGYTGAFLVVVK